MKRIILCTLAVLTVLACSKASDGMPDIAAGQLPISLAPSALVPTKAAIDGTVFPTDRTMVISAYHNVAQGTSGNYFSGIIFTRRGATWTADKYWPSSGTLDLLAVSYDGLTPASTTYESKASDGMTIAMPDNSSTQTDILHASAQTQSYTEGGTPLSFRHACALVVFNAKSTVAYDATNNLGITITKITLNNAYHSGTLAVTAAEDATEGYCTWSNLGNQKDVDVPDISSYNVQSASEGLSLGIGGAGIIVPEQSQTLFTVYYTIHNGKDAGGADLDNALQYTSACSGSWKEGKKYNYTLNFAINQVTVTPTVTDWVTESIGRDVPEKISASYAVSALISVMLPVATMATNTEVMVDWGDGSVEAFTNDATKSAVIDGDDITLSHIYSSAYTGKVNLCVRSGSLDFGTLETDEYVKFTVQDGTKVLVKSILLPGIFTVNSSGKTVRFTKGNLMANVNSDGTAVTEWKLADNQYDRLGNTTAQQQCKGGWVDLFGWTAAGKYSDGVKQYGINTSETASDYYISTVSGTSNTDTPCDWGSLVGTGLSLLSNTEWQYLMTNKIAKNSSNKYNFRITNTYCFILKPDGYSGSVADSYTAEEWTTAETAGLVALPLVGFRSGSSIHNNNVTGHYWSSVPYSKDFAYYVEMPFTSSPNAYITSRSYGNSVRLVSVQ